MEEEGAEQPGHALTAHVSNTHFTLQASDFYFVWAVTSLSGIYSASGCVHGFA